MAVSLVDAPKPSGAPNYTLEALHSLRSQLQPDSNLFCLMGADSFFSLRNWHRAAEIPFAAALIVASRPGENLDDLKQALPDGLTMDSVPGIEETSSDFVIRSCQLRNSAGDTAPFYLLPGLNVEFSASQLRDWIRDQLHAASATSIAGFDPLPKAVLDYIRAHRLYR